MRLLLAVVGGVLAFAGTPSAITTPTLYIPALHVFSPIASTLDGGPIVYYHSNTTTAIAAHRTHGPHLFYYLNTLKTGDLIRYNHKNYHVVKHAIVRPWQVWIENWNGLVLSACSRPDGTPTSLDYRYVVFAK